jgi:hypothetical protein
MTFFYDLNKRLQQALETPKSEHKQLNERDMSRAAKGYEKYGKEGMEALAKAGREGKALDPIRAKYDKYDESVEEGLGSALAKGFDKVGDMSDTAGAKLKGLKANITKNPKDRQAAVDAHRGIMKKEVNKHRDEYGQDPMYPERIGRYANAQQSAAMHKIGLDNNMEEGLGDMARKVGGAVKKVAGKALDTLGHSSDADMIRDLQRKMGATGTQVHGKKSMAQPKEAAAPMSAKQKSFAALAEPKDKITFADKIAGAKKEVDEMLGDVAANAMKSAVTSKGGTVTKTAKGVKHSAGPGVYGGSDQDSHPVDRMKGPSKKRLTGKSSMEEASDDDNNPFTNWKKPRAEKPKVGSVERGHKHDIEHTATGRKVTRRTDDQGYSVGADDDTEGKPVAKGRGRPKGTGGKIGAKGPSGKSKLMTKEGASEDDIQILVRLRDEAFEDGNKMLGNKIEDILQMMDDSEEQVSEKAVSKKQQRFMGMVHATQKGEKAPSKEVAKVAKSMGKKDAEDFAATKHKGLPEKKKPEGKKKEKTEEAGGSGTPTASSGFSYGKGIYDSMNRDLEDMISESMARLDSTLNESMSVNMSNSTEGGKSLTITATDDDAMKLASILKMAGLGGDEGYGGSGYKSACGCGSPDCSCGDEELDEVSMNEPDYPTNTETSNNVMQYSGGLDGPKSTGQSTVPVLASQDERQGTYAEAEEDAIKRMMEMAGVKKKEVDEEKTEEGNLFTGNLAKARAAGKKQADLDGDGDMEKVDEGIIAATRNLWKTYQPK